MRVLFPIALILLTSTMVHAVGQMAVPDASGTQVQSTVTHKSIQGTDGEQYTVYFFKYEIARPESDTGPLTRVSWDLFDEPPFERRGVRPPPGYDFKIPVGPGEGNLQSFDSLAEENVERVGADRIFPRRQIRFGMKRPEGWISSFIVGRAVASPASGNELLPGERIDGFELYSPAPPTIRKMELHPFWQYVVESQEEWDPEDQARASEIQKEIIEHRRVIGPSYVRHRSNAHWIQLRSDIQESATLGWSEEGTAESLVSLLQQAWDLARGDEPWLARPALEELMEKAEQAYEQGRMQQGISRLIYHNARILESGVAEEPPPPVEPAYEVEPLFQEHDIGATAHIEGHVYNLAADDAPLPNHSLQMAIASGPHAGHRDYAQSDADGRFSFSYQGTDTGLDRIYINEALIITSFSPSSVDSQSDDQDPIAWLEVDWRGGPDLVPEMFAPVYLRWDGDVEVFFEDITANIGNVAAGESTTRFYISDSQDFDPEYAYPVVERRVPPLGPGERHRHVYGRHSLPDHLDAGEYWLTACVDADDEVVELDDTNNCDSGQIIMTLEPAPDTSPVCEDVGVSPQYLWPPNHKMREVELVKAEEGDPDQISVTRVMQNEPIDGIGDGATQPDAALGPEPHELALRAERSGRNPGRIYWVEFEGRNVSGDVCKGTAQVFVAHDRRQPPLEADSSARYDSLTGERVH